MSGLFKATVIKGTRITDFSTTSAEVGRPIPFGYGSIPVDGTVIWCPLPPTEHRDVKRQGKGGVKQETFTYTLSYAILFLRGRSYGYRWIKRNGKVVYTTDPNAPIEDQEYAAKWAERVTFHDGAIDQLPDALIEAHEGVGNVSGFPLDSYIAIEEEDVTENGGAPPNYEAVIIATPPEAFLTSLPYAQQFASEASSSFSVESVTVRQLRIYADAGSDSFHLTPRPVGGELVNLLKSASAPPDGFEFGPVPTEGSLALAIQYATQKKDGFEFGPVPIGGSLVAIPIGTQEKDGFEFGPVPIGGSLT